MASEINEHVTITTTQNAVGASFAGFGTQGIVSCNATFPERSRTYTDLPEMITDGMGTKTPEYRAAQKALSQKPRPKQIKILRTVGKPTLRYQLDILSPVTAGYTYALNVKGTTIVDTSISFTTKADVVFTAANATELFTSAAHGMTTGDGPFRVSNSGGALPAGLAVDTDYWVIATVAAGVADPINTFQLATSKANALAGTELLITTDGTGTQTLLRTQNDVVCAQLVQGLNAIASKNYTATQTVGAGETDFVVVTGTAPGDWFSIEITNLSLIKIEQTHAEPATSIATDMAAISEADSDFYGIEYLYPSDACVKAMAAWTETAGKIYVQAMSDSTIATAISGGGDTASDLKALNYARTSILYHGDPASFASAAWKGRVLSTEPGKATWKFKNLKGVVGSTLTATQRINLRAKNANGYTVVGANATTWEGKVCSGRFIDSVRNFDWLDDRLLKRVYNALEGNDIVPFTDSGIAIIHNEIEATLSEAVKRNILAGGDETPVVTVPKASAVAESDRGQRLLPDIAWSGREAGAIHKGEVNGNVSL